MIKKLGYGIVVFDDVFHLKNMISEVRDYCDEVVICLQKKSYYGSPIDQYVVDYANKLVDEHLVDHIIWFTPTKLYKDKGPHAPRFIETDKRNFILDFLEYDCECSHSIVIDSDEFYDGEDFARAKSMINNADVIRVSYCQYINYYRDYCHVMVWPFKCYVPFISESCFRFDFEKGTFDRPSDPTRRYCIEDPDIKYCIFNFQTIKMHHLSWIREDVTKKIDNWSSKKYFEDKVGLRDSIIERYNNYRDGLNAIIMFNVPNNEVIVDKLKYQYINPKYSLI